MKKSILKINNFIYFFISLLFISSCYEHQEGCRDINALNFDVTADIDCEDNCCSYPKVYISFKSTINDSIRIDTNTTIVNSFGDTIRIKMLRIYTTNFSLIDNDQELHRILKTVTIAKNDSSDYENINFTSVKLKTISSNYEIGTLTKNKVYNRIIFNFGIDSLINHSVLDKIELSSPLHQASDSLYINTSEGFYFLKLIVEINNDYEKIISIKGDKNIQTIELSGEFNFSKRESHYIPLELKIDRLFKEIDFTKETEEEIAVLLEKNIISSFKIYDK